MNDFANPDFEVIAYGDVQVGMTIWMGEQTPTGLPVRGDDVASGVWAVVEGLGNYEGRTVRMVAITAKDPKTGLPWSMTGAANDRVAVKRSVNEQSP